MKAQRSIVQISFAFLILCSAISVASVPVKAQALNAGTITGVVTDPNNAVVPIAVKIPLAVTTASETVTVTSNAADVLENTSTTHTDVDQSLITRLPVRSV